MVAALVKDGKEVAELKTGESGAVVVNQTPFYGESGGQVGDTGEMRRDGVRLTVTDTQKKAGDLFAHLVKVEEGAVKIGDPLLMEVDHARRAAIRQNHSATHRCTRLCARSWASMSRRRARWWRPTGCVSISRIRSQ